MNAAIDFGSHRIRVLTCEEDHLVARSFRAAYSVLEDSQQQRNVLDRLNLPYAVCDSHLAVIGDYTDEIRCVNSVPSVPLFADGRVASDDPPARQILNVLVEAMLPSGKSSDRCAVIAPSNFTPGEGSLEFLKQLVTLRGYEPLHISSGLATVLADGSSERFTAIGISLGAQCCDLSLVLRGNEMDHEVVSRAGDWMDVELARRSSQVVFDRSGQCYLDTDAIPSWKHAEFRSLTRGDSDLEHSLIELYAELAAELSGSIAALVSRNPLSEGPVPVLCTGGLTHIAGFEEMLRDAIRARGLTTDQIGPVRIVSDPLLVARGGLIQVALQNVTRSVAA